MTIRNVGRKLSAVDVGGPLPIYKTKLTRIVANPLVIAFVRMAGESRPWGIAYGRAQDVAPKYLSAPDPRNRESVHQVIEVFAQWFLTENRVEGFCPNPIREDNSDAQDLIQVWFPGSTHVDMLHFLQYQYQKNRMAENEPTALGAFGRLAGWLFRQSQLRGNQWVIDATQLINEMYEFPTDDFSLRHLGVQLAWLQSPGSLQEKRANALEAMKSPVSITMAPQYERDHLEPLLKEKKVGLIDFTPAQIESVHSALVPEMQRRWMMAVDAHRLALVTDSRTENKGVGHLVTDQVATFIKTFNIPEASSNLDNEETYTPAATTSYSPFVSAREFLTAERAQQRWLPILVHDDAELLLDAVIEGTAFSGTVVSTDLVKSGANMVPQWQVRLTPKSSKYFKRRTQERLKPFGSPQREVTVTGFELKEELWTVTIKWDKANPIDVNGQQLLPKDPAWIGKTAVFVSGFSDFFFFNSMKAIKSAGTGAGAWILDYQRSEEGAENADD